MTDRIYDGMVVSRGVQRSIGVRVMHAAAAQGDGRCSVVCTAAAPWPCELSETAAALTAAAQCFLSDGHTRDGGGVRTQAPTPWTMGGRLSTVEVGELQRLRMQARTQPMEMFQVTIDGHVYEVTVSKVGQEAAPAPRLPKIGKGSASAPHAPHVGERAVRAPMPGKVLGVNVVEGETVDTDTVLLVVEAMKMENAILAPGQGTVKTINVQPGDTVKTGDVMMVVE